MLEFIVGGVFIAIGLFYFAATLRSIDPLMRERLKKRELEEFKKDFEKRNKKK